MIILRDEKKKKGFNKIQSAFMIKTLSKLEIEGKFLSLMKDIYKNPTTNIILNGEKLKVFPLRSGRRQVWPLSTLLFNIILKVLSNARKQENKIKGI